MESTISTKDLKAKLDRKQGITVVETLATERFREAHIPGALALPLQELKRRLSELPRNKEIVAYCRGPYCALAIDAVRLLRARGLRAHRLEASVQDWHARGLPVATGL